MWVVTGMDRSVSGSSPPALAARRTMAARLRSWLREMSSAQTCPTLPNPTTARRNGFTADTITLLPDKNFRHPPLNRRCRSARIAHHDGEHRHIIIRDAETSLDPGLIQPRSREADWAGAQPRVTRREHQILSGETTIFLAVMRTRSRTEDDQRPSTMEDMVVGTGDHVAILLERGIRLETLQDVRFDAFRPLGQLLRILDHDKRPRLLVHRVGSLDRCLDERLNRRFINRLVRIRPHGTALVNGFHDIHHILPAYGREPQYRASRAPGPTRG